MSVNWNNADFMKFFGAAPVPMSDGELFTLSYTGRLLKYEVTIDASSDIVLISGSPETPFGADSLFEVVVPCDSISACADGYYPEQTGLVFWYGDPERTHNLTLELLKRPDGDLKVWPGCVWPRRHSHFEVLWGDNTPPVAYEPAADE